MPLGGGGLGEEPLGGGGEGSGGPQKGLYPGVAGPSSYVPPPLLSLPEPPVGIYVAAAVRSATVFAPRVRRTSWNPRVQAFVGADELIDTFDRSWQEVLSDTGNGELSIMNDDPQLADLPFGALVKFAIDGEVKLTTVVEKKTKAAAAEGGDQVTTVSGRGLMAEWEDTVVYPWGGPGKQPTSDTRVFNWASPGIDGTGWKNSHGLFPQNQRDFYAGVTLRGLPPDWPEQAEEVFWIWGVPWTVNVPHRVGDNYFRSWFYVNKSGPYAIFVAGDNGWDFYLDGMFFHGENFPSTVGYSELHRIEVELTKGYHLIGAKVTNFAPNKPSNYGGLLMAVFDIVGAEANNLGHRIHETSAGAAWKSLAYPHHPTGWTMGRIIRTLLQEAQARGALEGWTLGFTDKVDSKGNPWPIALETSFEVGLDLLSALRQLADTYLEFKCSPTKRRLYAYVDGAAGRHTNVEFVPGDNVTELTIEGES